MQIRVLGSSRAATTGGEQAELALGSRKPRAIVAALALTPGRPVPADRLADLVWGGEPPRAAHGALHAYISGLRKVFDPDRASREAASLLETTDHGYVLRVAEQDVDALAFATTVTRVERALAPLGTLLDGGDRAGWPDRAAVGADLDVIDDALATWSGEPYADLPEHPDVLAARAGLERLREAAEELRLLALLALGEHTGVLSATEAATSDAFLRERLWALHAVALTRAGRQAEALDALRTVRAHLADELGLDPGPELQALEQAILRQDDWVHATLPEPAAPAQAASRPPSSAEVAAPSGSVGREHEREVLSGLLAVAAGGAASAAYVVGEPGIGKSRLVADLLTDAEKAGFRVGVGRCSQDDGAPPLWPWLAVLRDLGRTLPAPSDPDTTGPGQAAFETRQWILDELVAVAAEAPVLVTLDDLHWADEATLRALAHVVTELPATTRCLLVATRRTHPEPTGSQALVAESFARRHAVRLDLTGLTLPAATHLLGDAGGYGGRPGRQVEEWHRRSGGNPFFLLELARLGGDGAEVPATVRDVVTRRLEQLPERALETLRTAAVAGRRFLPETVAAASGADLDEVSDDLETAAEIGLLVDGTDATSGELAFSHALTRDAVYLSMSGGRRARRHAQVGHALDTDPDLGRLVPPSERTAELARHWLAAGPAHADRAWRAARAAARQAHELADYHEAATVGRAGVEAQRRSGAGEAERYDLLLEVARDAAYAAIWSDVVDAAFEGIAVGRSMGRPDLVGQAASAITQYAVWTPHEWCEVFEDVIDDLRWALAEVDEEDLETRCRLQLALAVELYYVTDAVAERRALVDSGLLLADRLGDPRVLAWANRAAWTASWTPEWTIARRTYAEKGLAAARSAGDPAAEAVALVSLAADLLELEGPAAWHGPAREAEALAHRHQLPYVLLTINWVEFNLATIRYDDEEAERRIAALWEVSRDVAIPSKEIQPAASIVLSRLWNGTLDEVIDFQLPVVETLPMAWSTVAGLLVRSGRPDQARTFLDTHPYVEPGPTWQTLSSYSFLSEPAAVLGDRDLGETCYRNLSPYAGRMSVAGVAVAQGPVDGYLALAALSLGERAEATEHAERAVALAEEWELPAYLDWFRAHRERLAF